MLCNNTIFHSFKNNNMNPKKALCFLLPVLMLIVSELFGYNFTEHAQYYTKSTYWQNEYEHMTNPACPLVFDIVFFDGGEDRPADPLVTEIPQCPLRSTILGGQSLGLPIPMGQNGMPVPVWLEIFDPATGVMLLMKIYVTPEGCIGTIHIEQENASPSWDYDLTPPTNLSFTPLVGENPSTALTLGFNHYISTGHLIANISAGYILKVYYCIPGVINTGGYTAAPYLTNTPRFLRLLPTTTQALFSQHVNPSADQARHVADSPTEASPVTINSVINNPVSDILHLRLNQPDKSHIIEATLWSVQGQPVSDRHIIAPGETQVDIPTSSLSPGLYVLRLKSEGNSHTHIFVKM
jgi:hypothetical protein